MHICIVFIAIVLKNLDCFVSVFNISAVSYLKTLCNIEIKFIRDMFTFINFSMLLRCEYKKGNKNNSEQLTVFFKFFKIFNFFSCYCCYDICR